MTSRQEPCPFEGDDMRELSADSRRSYLRFQDRRWHVLSRIVKADVMMAVARRVRKIAPRRARL
jgi:hypothetical protein